MVWGFHLCAQRHSTRQQTSPTFQNNQGVRIAAFERKKKKSNHHSKATDRTLFVAVRQCHTSYETFHDSPNRQRRHGAGKRQCGGEQRGLHIKTHAKRCTFPGSVMGDCSAGAVLHNRATQCKPWKNMKSLLPIDETCD